MVELKRRFAFYAAQDQNLACPIFQHYIGVVLDLESVMSDVEEKSKIVAYPVTAVHACLLSELTLLAEAEANMQGVALPTPPASLVTMKIRLDSLTIVDLTCALEPILGYEPKDIVRTGGYDSIQSALDHMLPRIEAAWRRKHPGAA